MSGLLTSRSEERTRAGAFSRSSTATRAVLRQSSLVRLRRALYHGAESVGCKLAMPHHEHDGQGRYNQHIAAHEPAQISKREKERPLAAVEVMRRDHVH